MWSKEDVDEWIDVLAHVIDEAYTDPERVRTAPHNQAIRKLDATDLNDAANWATTWRAYERKRPAPGTTQTGDATGDYAKAAT
jgi:glycine dehydrogenase subunit 2